MCLKMVKNAIQNTINLQQKWWITWRLWGRARQCRGRRWRRRRKLQTCQAERGTPLFPIFYLVYIFICLMINDNLICLAKQREEHLRYDFFMSVWSVIMWCVLPREFFIFNGEKILMTTYLQVLQVRIRLTLEEAAENAGNARHYLKRKMTNRNYPYREMVMRHMNGIITWQELRMSLRPQH